MTRTTDLIAELVRAANGIARVNTHERRRLLESGLSSIRALTELMTKSGIKVNLDGASFRARGHIAAHLDRFPEDTIARIMLGVAHELRILRTRHRSFVDARNKTLSKLDMPAIPSVVAFDRANTMPPFAEANP